MLRYILKRLLLLIPTLLGILAITFAVIQFVPGGPVEQMVAQLSNSQVGAESSGGGSFWAVCPLGGLTSDNWADLSLAQKISDYLWHMALPITAMVAGNLAVMTVLTKNVFLEEIRRQYVYTARAKGLPERQILLKHVFRNALIPLVTGFPAAFIGAFFTGSLLIETLFSLDGLGLLSYQSVIKRDYPVVMGTLYVFTLLGLLAKLLSDLSYMWIDPRIHFDGQER